MAPKKLDAASAGHPNLLHYWASKRPRDDANSSVPPQPTRTTVPPPSAGRTQVVTAHLPDDPSPSSLSGSLVAHDVAVRVARTACKHFAAGRCRDGARCRYAHVAPDAAAPPVAPSVTTLVVSTETTAVCRYYASSGGCRLGARCHLLHYNDFGYGVLHVPWSILNTYAAPSGKHCAHWNLITEQLFESNVTNTSDLTELLVDLLPPLPGNIMKHRVFPTDYQELVAVLDETMAATERTRFFKHVLPFMKSMVLRGRSFFPEGVPVLMQGKPGAVRLTETQVLVLLACAFFSLFPGRHRCFSKDQFNGNSELEKHCGKLGFVNFGALFGFHQPQARHKIRCFISYFETQYERRVLLGLEGSASPQATMHIEVIRKVKEGSSPTPFDACRLKLSPIVLHHSGVIEDAHGVLQADFANHVLGGGVLHRGCVQEEIRFAICPELMVSRMVCESLRKDEAVVVHGAAEFSRYVGYASTFQFAGPCTIPSPTEREAKQGIRDISIVAFDAVNYNGTNLTPTLQYLQPWMERDTTKAYVAFQPTTGSSLACASVGPVATGNWGCGAFGGDVELKLVQQWIAASACGRPLTYYTFGNRALCEAFAALEPVLRAANCTVKDLHGTVMLYHTARTAMAVRRASSSRDVLRRQGSANASTTAALVPGATEVDVDAVDDGAMLDESTEDFFGDDGSVGAAPTAADSVRSQTVFEYLIEQFSP